MGSLLLIGLGVIVFILSVRGSYKNLPPWSTLQSNSSNTGIPDSNSVAQDILNGALNGSNNSAPNSSGANLTDSGNFIDAFQNAANAAAAQIVKNNRHIGNQN